MKKSWKRIVSVLLALAMVILSLPEHVSPVKTAKAAEGDVTYVDENNNTVILSAGDYEVIDNDNQPTTWTNGKTYVVGVGRYAQTKMVTVNTRIEVSGSVKLVILEGYTLSLSRGIHVTGNNALSIYGEGALTARLSTDENGQDRRNAAIGGNNSESAGTILIVGCTITARGGYRGAGIGGGRHDNGGQITILGGNVSATGTSGGAGIGGGGSGNGGTITISGGTVTANGGSGAAGIGGGGSGNGGTITIAGGTVTAQGGSGAAGIGGGSGAYGGTIAISGDTTVVTAIGGANNSGGGAGIGGGTNPGAFTTGAQSITISGGKVTATSGNSSTNTAAIGGGYMQSRFGSITISGGEVTATGSGSTGTMGIGGYHSSDPIYITGGVVNATSNYYTGYGIIGSTHISITDNNSSVTAKNYTYRDYSYTTYGRVYLDSAIRLDGTTTVYEATNGNYLGSQQVANLIGNKLVIAHQLYTITFKNDDEAGTVLYACQVAEGQTPIYGGTEPTKEASAQYTYSFNGTWSPAITAASEDATYIAQFDRTVRKYTITWVDGDRKTLATEDVEYGKTPEYRGEETPTKEQTPEFTYSFNGEWNPAITPVSGAATYTAQFDGTRRQYTVSFTYRDSSGEITTVNSTVDFGTLLASIAPQDIPEQPANEAKTWTFNGWDFASDATVTGEKTYTAQYAEETNRYQVTFRYRKEDGDFYDEVKELEYGKDIASAVPEIPETAANAKNTWTLTGWDFEEGTTVTGETTYEAQYNETVNEYSLTFRYRIADGSYVTESASGQYGQLISEIAPEILSEVTDGNYTYALRGWDFDEGATITEEDDKKTYSAEYNETPNPFDITFKYLNNDGSETEVTDTYDYDTLLSSIAPEVPESPKNAQYTWTFTGWDFEEDAKVTGKATYNAQYTYVVNQYEVTFKYLTADGTVTTYTGVFDYGTDLESIAPTDIPTNPKDAQFTWTFSRWDFGEDTEVVHEAIYNAEYDSVTNTYKVTFKYRDENGEYVETEDATYEYGTLLGSIVPEAPTSPKNAQYTWTFEGWNFDADAIVTGEATYTARYSDPDVNKYLVTFVNDDENHTVLSSEELEFGATPMYEDTPTKVDDDQYRYTFSGWSPEIKDVDGEITYFAVYSAEPLYAVNIDNGISGGNVRTNLANGRAVSGEQVVLTVDSANDFEWYQEDLLVTVNGTPVEVSSTDASNQFAFTMPDGDVFVTMMFYHQYPVWVGSKQMSDKWKEDVLEDGNVKFSYEDGIGKLTFADSNPGIIGLHNESVLYSNGVPLVIEAPSGLNISSSEATYGIYIGSYAGLTINGDINITITKEDSASYAIYVGYPAGLRVNGNLTVTNQYGRGVNTYGGFVVTGKVKASTYGTALYIGYGTLEAVIGTQGVTYSDPVLDVTCQNGPAVQNVGGQSDSKPLIINGDVKIVNHGENGVGIDSGSGTYKTTESVRINGDVDIDVTWTGISGRYGVVINGDARITSTAETYNQDYNGIWGIRSESGFITVNGDLTVKGVQAGGLNANNAITITGEALITSKKYPGIAYSYMAAECVVTLGGAATIEAYEGGILLTGNIGKLIANGPLNVTSETGNCLSVIEVEAHDDVTLYSKATQNGCIPGRAYKLTFDKNLTVKSDAVDAEVIGVGGFITVGGDLTIDAKTSGTLLRATGSNFGRAVLVVGGDVLLNGDNSTTPILCYGAEIQGDLICPKARGCILNSLSREYGVYVGGNVEGNVTGTVSPDYNSNTAYIIKSMSDITLAGDVTAELGGTGYGIYAEGTVTMKSGIWDVTVPEGSLAVYAKKGIVIPDTHIVSIPLDGKVVTVYKAETNDAGEQIVDYYTIGTEGEDAALATHARIEAFDTVSVEIRWDDVNNQDGYRPGSLTLELSVVGQEGSIKAVLDADDWTANWKVSALEDKGNFTVSAPEVEHYISRVTTNGEGMFTVVYSHEIEKVSVTTEVIWNDNNNKEGFRPESVTVKMFANGDEIDKVTLNEESQWKYTWPVNPKFEDGKEIQYTISEAQPANYKTPVTEKVSETEWAYTVTNSRDYEETEVKVTEEWSDWDNSEGFRPSEVTVRLFADGEEVDSVTLNAENEWKHTWSNRQKYAGGEAILYTVTEDPVKGYETSIAQAADGSFIYLVANSRTVEMTQVDVTLAWDDSDNEEGFRSEYVIIKLMKGDREISSVLLNAENKWTYTWTNLQKYENATVVNYSVTEDPVANYSTQITKATDGTFTYTVKNSRAVEKTQVSVVTIWDDNNNKEGFRPDDVTVTLLANGAKIGTATLNADDEWEHTWDGLNKFADGKEIVYTVSEAQPANYKTPVTEKVSETEWAYTVTNSREYEEVEVKVTKVWDDADNKDGYRSDDVIVHLKKGNTVFGTASLNKDNNWSYTWTNLQKYENGTAIDYTVTEDEVSEYTTDITKAADGTFTYTITNSHKAEETEVKVTKVWDDADNQDGYRTDVTVNLLADGKVIDSVTLSEDNNWSYSWTKLDKKAAGKEIDYTVTEEEVPQYSAKIEKATDGTFTYTITNSHKTEETEVKVTKVWDDADNQDGYRTADVTVNLLADGDVIDTVTLSEDNNWSYSWTKLDKKAAGKVIDYTVTEDEVSKYETEIVKASDAVIGGVVDGTSDGIVTNQYNTGEVTEGTGDGTFSYIITNSHTPETISPIVKVVWVDEDDRNGKRPESVDSVLVNDEEESKGTVTLGLETEWTETAKEPVAKYKNGGTPVKYTWTITSELPAGYEVVDTAEDGLTTTITIAYIAKPVKLPLEVVKVLTGREWNEKDAFEFTLAADAENPDGAELPEVTVVNVTAETKTVAFDEIVFSKRGTYKFTITETKGTLDGVSYDTVAKELVVVVEDDGVGSLYIDEVTNKGSVEITNVYSSVGAIQFAAKKVLDGRELKDGEFTFVLKNEAGEVLQTATCDKDGKISFEPIAYTEKDMVVDGKIVATREYTYTISEVKPEGEKYDALIVYDESVKTIKVTLTDNQDGTITADAKTTDANITFTNVKLAEYEITFVDEDGTTVLKAARKYVVGTKAADVEKPVNPTKKEDDSFTYEFSGWTPEISDVAGDVTYKATYKATAKPGVYYLVGDAPSAQKGNGNGLVMQFKRTVKDEITFDQFDGISFNGNVLSKDLYKAVKGSVIITVPQEFINSLSDGKNEVIVTFKDGDPVKVSVEILPAQSSEDDPVDPNKNEEEKKVSPKTADTMVYGWMIVLLGISGVTVLLVIRRRREEEEQIGM